MYPVLPHTAVFLRAFLFFIYFQRRRQHEVSTLNRNKRSFGISTYIISVLNWKWMVFWAPLFSWKEDKTQKLWLHYFPVQGIVNVTEACKEVKNSKKFAKFLEFVLLCGNYMNAGSKNERSYGYDLNLLIKVWIASDCFKNATHVNCLFCYEQMLVVWEIFVLFLPAWQYKNIGWKNDFSPLPCKYYWREVPKYSRIRIRVITCWASS